MSNLRFIRGLEPGRRPALVISECQRGILDIEFSTLPQLVEQAQERAILPRIAELASEFRTLRLPVIHAHICHRPDLVGAMVTSPLAAVALRSGGLVEGTSRAESMPEVAPMPGDVVSARRSGLVMWFGTDMDVTLRSFDIDTVVLCGVSTNLALFGGALGAVERGYQAVVAEDCSAGATAESHRFMITESLPMLATIATAAEMVGQLTSTR